MLAPTTRHDDFVQAARRHRPSVLLPALAAVSARQFTGGAYRNRPNELIYPWIISAAARENIAFGNEHRSEAMITDTVLGKMRNVYINLNDRFLTDLGAPDALDSFLVRTAYEQMPYQHSNYEDMARILLLFDRDYTGLGCRVLSLQAWEQILGLPLDTFMRAGFLLLVGAHSNAGWFDPAWLHQPNLTPALERLKLSADDVLTVLHGVFGSTFDSVRRRVVANRNPDALLRRYDFNPLVETPLVQMGDGRYLAPSLPYVAQRLSPASLYYVGLALGAQHFSSDLGAVTEMYVGEQFDLVETELVLHDVGYEPGKRSADYIVVLPGVTLVIEVKSARIAQPGRLDRDGYLDDLNRDVGKALKQIRRTAGLLRDGHPALAAAARPGQPIRGIVVTAEPHYMLNSPFYRDQIADPGIPTVILSLSELENAVGAAAAGRPGDLFAGLTDWTSGGIDVPKVLTSHRKMLGVPTVRNALLDAAYDRAWGDLRPRPEPTPDSDEGG